MSQSDHDSVELHAGRRGDNTPYNLHTIGPTEECPTGTYPNIALLRRLEKKPEDNAQRASRSSITAESSEGKDATGRNTTTVESSAGKDAVGQREEREESSAVREADSEEEEVKESSERLEEENWRDVAGAGKCPCTGYKQLLGRNK
ncbi:hypothetical protein NDU88_006028 [Pleurodeles waltl]|uniref:Uncharacterized protein n=1 Tax=Pleurodeles waltl TaxID=8319 RepID=A0AAV7MZQ4_PLEWA|nr:hypothetical protein NDU88_006028 [Pleurodeles waltl]